MSVTVTEVTNKKQKQAFINLPWKLYHNDPNWVPPLKMAVEDLLSPNHPVWQTADLKLYLAYDEHQNIIGRIATSLNKRHIEFHNERCLFWGFFESVDREEVAKALFEKVDEVAKSLDINLIRGPFNPSTNYECGLLTDGFDDPPQIMMTYNPKFYVDILENKLQMKRAKNLLAYEFDLNIELPEKITKIAKRLAKRNKVTWRKVSKKNWDQEVQHMLDIYNDAWEQNWGFIPMTEQEFLHTAKDLKSVVNEDLVLFCEVDDKPVGFIVALPDFNQVLKRVRDGRLFPTGLFKILFNQRKINRFRVITLGLKKEYQVKGLSTILYVHLYEHLKTKTKFRKGEFSWILEDNYKMNSPLLLMGAQVYKNYAIYERRV